MTMTAVHPIQFQFMPIRSLRVLNRINCFSTPRPFPRIVFHFYSAHREAHRLLSTMPTKHYDNLVLGSGQAGTPLASHLRSLNQTVCLVERSHIAGCCVNEGCTPTKTMVASGRVAYLSQRSKDYGISTSQGGGVQVNMKKVRQRKRDIVTSFRGGSERRLKSAGVDVLMGEARFLAPKEVAIELTAGGEEKVSADRIFINVGCRPSRPVVSGLDDIDQTRVLDSTSIQELDEVPEHLVVLGGGYIGLEFGQLFKRLGAKVTIVHRGERLLSRSEDREVVECMQGILEDDGIEILLRTTATSIAKSEDTKLPIKISTTPMGQSKVDLQASHILLATGRIPNTESLDLPSAGIKTSSSGHIVASPLLETNIEGVYALGDVKGGPAFTHISYDDFRIIRDNLERQTSNPQGGAKSTNERASIVPSVVYTDPQLAHIGPKWTALPKHKPLVTYSMPASWIARGLETDETRGMLKAVVDPETDGIVSFSAIAVEGGELMAVVQMAMVGGLTWKQLRDMVFAHPSWAECLNNLWGGERKEVFFE